MLTDIVKSVTEPVKELVVKPVTDILEDFEEDTKEIMDAVATPFTITYDTTKTVVNDLVDALKGIFLGK